MIKVHVTLGKYNWELFAYFAVTRYDVDDIMEHLWEIGCDGQRAQEAYDNLNTNALNTGLTYSSFVKRKSVMVTAVADSPAQFFNSLIHETAHCVNHIADTLYIDKDSEEYAYLMGDLSMAIFPHISTLLCECCNKRKRHKLLQHIKSFGHFLL